MPDDKKGRDKQARDKENRQRKREMEEARERADEEEPMRADEEEPRERADEEEPMRGDLDDRLGDLDEELDSHDYPATTDELVEAYGDYTVETRDGEESLEDVLSSTDNQTYDSADDVRGRVLGLIHR